MADYVGLETSGHVLLEDGTSGLLLETSPSFSTWTGSATVSETVTVTTAGVAIQLALIPRSPGSLTLTSAVARSLVLLPRPVDTVGGSTICGQFLCGQVTVGTDYEGLVLVPRGG